MKRPRDDGSYGQYLINGVPPEPDADEVRRAKKKKKMFKQLAAHGIIHTDSGEDILPDDVMATNSLANDMNNNADAEAIWEAYVAYAKANPTKKRERAYELMTMGGFHKAMDAADLPAATSGAYPKLSLINKLLQVTENSNVERVIRDHNLYAYPASANDEEGQSTGSWDSVFDRIFSVFG